MDATQRIHVFFTGKVQGVGFRQSTREFALDLGLKGWIKNLADMRVEMVAEGNEPDLRLLIGKLRKEFQIDKVEVRTERPEGLFKGFEIVE
jgi:acylphosphatase